MVSRRTLLGLLASAAAEAFQQPSFGDTPALKSGGTRCGRYVGVQAEKPQLQDSRFADFVIRNFNMLTPGNEMKWQRLRPNPDVYRFADADWIMNFAMQNHLAVHGHNLCWNVFNPAWFKQVLTKSNARQYLTDHITTVMRRYTGKIDSWDVVNEPVALWLNREDGLYPGPWLDLLGQEYIDIAFHAAASADPTALRILNINDVEQDKPIYVKSRAVTLDLIKALLKRQVPIQAIGLESHLTAAFPASSDARNRFIRELRDLGLEVLITEMDVNDTAIPGDVRTRDTAVAAYYYAYLTEVVSSAVARRIIFWTLSDKGNWLAFEHGADFVRADGQPLRPGLLDDELAPKPAFDSAKRALDGLCRS
jgi:endo-1,4-beta-xylanase